MSINKWAGVLLALVAAGLGGCASQPPKNAPGCSGQWRSLNPAHHQAAATADTQTSEVGGNE
jgi:type IV pilus biogenesis protein CpaD/CtpE